jgi:hypothetical protein
MQPIKQYKKGQAHLKPRPFEPLASRHASTPRPAWQRPSRSRIHGMPFKTSPPPGAPPGPRKSAQQGPPTNYFRPLRAPQNRPPASFARDPAHRILRVHETGRAVERVATWQGDQLRATRTANGLELGPPGPCQKHLGTNPEPTRNQPRTETGSPSGSGLAQDGFRVGSGLVPSWFRQGPEGPQ